MVDLISCPTWCTEHFPADPTEGDTGGSHYSAPESMTLSRSPAAPPVHVRNYASDRDGGRYFTIDVDSGDSAWLELTPAEARQLSVLLATAADRVEAADLSAQ
ncbi:DUF6907 domain-containing protein [Nocardia sp. IFM 10818]